jgi:DNA-binding SARP family transcriptional activator
MRQESRVTANTALVSVRAVQSTDIATEAVSFGSSGAVRAEIADQDPGSIGVDLLGGLSVRAGGMIMGPRDLGGTKPRLVLLALLQQRGAPVSKERLVSLLWEGTPPSGAKATLEAYVCVLRKKLQPHHSARGSLITTVAGCYAIDMTRVDLDLVRFERLMSAALQQDTSATDALPLLQQAMEYAQKPMLPEELNCEWLDEVRESHVEDVRKARISAATKVAGLASGDAERWARLALDGDSLDESAWLALLHSMESNGHHAAALKAYDRCRKMFSAELGCAPGPGLQDVYVRLLRGASEEDGELSQLLEAVVRLHKASSECPLPAMAGRGIGRRDVIGQASIEQAWGALDMLLRSVRGGSLQFAAVGA